MPKPYVYMRAEQLGLPIVDATARLLVTVTQDDVVKAKKADSKHCALARAALRLPKVQAAYFFRSKAFLEYTDKMVRFELPESVRREIVSFDRAQIMAAGVYSLAPMPASSTYNNRSQEVARRKAKKTRDARAVKATAQKGISSAMIAKIAAGEPKNDTPEQREFDNRIATLENRFAGNRTVSGIKRKDAPEPLIFGGSPKKRHVHHTQYIRDLNEPNHDAHEPR